MGKIRNALGRVLPFIPPGTTRSAYVRGSIRRRLQSFDNRVINAVGDLESASGVVAALLGAQVADLVGTGVRPTLNTGTDALDDRLMVLWESWGEDAEVTGLAFDDAIALAVRGWLRDGEAFLILTNSGRVQVLGAADLPATPDTQGVECDAAGRPVAYHFRPGMDTIRVEAASVLHLAHRTHPRQLRGVSPLLPALGKIQDLEDYDRAEQAAAKAAAKVAYVIRSEAAAPVLPRDDDGNLDDDLPDGMAFDRLLPGESVEVVNATRPNSELPAYRAALLRSIAATAGADYSSVSREAQGSFSASRSISVISNRDADFRFALLQRQVLRPLWRWLAAGWQERGQVALTEGARYPAMRPTWIRRGRPDWVDPLRMASAMEKMLSAELATKEELRQHFSGFGQ